MATNAERSAASQPGLTWTAIRTPEPEDPVRPAIVGGAIGWGLALLAGARSPGRLLAAGLGVAAGALASRYRVRLEWDPRESEREIPILEPEPRALIDPSEGNQPVEENDSVEERS